MFDKTFHFDAIRKYVILFGTLFNDIWINRRDSDGNVLQSMRVPLSYSPREKLLARVQTLAEGRDPEDQPFSVTLPRMGFEITGFEYDAARKQTTLNKFYRKTNTDKDKRTFQYNPVPYNITFDLSIFVKNTSDGTMIIEQILPFFTPEWNSTIILDDDIDPLDIPLIINSIAQEDVYEGSFEERRSLIWTLTFTMKGYFFGPKHDQGIIKLANVNFNDSTLFTDIDDPDSPILSRVTVYPGLDANGNPTTDANTTIHRDEITKDDNYDYIVQIEENPDEQ